VEKILIRFQVGARERKGYQWRRLEGNGEKIPGMGEAGENKRTFLTLGGRMGKRGKKNVDNNPPSRNEKKEVKSKVSLTIKQKALREKGRKERGESTHPLKI